MSSSTILLRAVTMGLKSLALVLWLSHCVSIAFAVSREFSGSGYLEYKILADADIEQINSNEDELRLKFKTVQPTGLLFHTQNSGGELGDYLTLELCGGRLCFGMQLGSRKDQDDKKSEILGKDLSNGKSHEVLVTHKRFITTIVLNQGTLDEEERKIETRYEKLEVDIAIFVGGAPTFQNLQGVKSNAPFIGCLTDVEFKPEGKDAIKFLVKGVTDAVNVDMDKECSSAPSFEPYTFYDPDSSFTFKVKKSDAMTGSFKFRSYKKSGTLLKQVNGNNGFTISYTESSIRLKVKIGNTDTDVSIPYSPNEQKVNSGNWHTIVFDISDSTFSLKVGTKAPPPKAYGVGFPANFFSDDAVAGGFTGCMRDLIVNKEEKKPIKGVSKINKVETDSCNITDLCIFSPCLNKGSCSQDGRTFECDCSTSGYEKPMCQFPDSAQNCEQLKKRLPKDRIKDGNWTLDLDGPGPLKASSGIYCNMTADPAITVVFSEDQGVKVITDNNAGTVNQPYVADIRYYPSLDFAKALAMNSENCKQFIEFGCKNAKLLNAGEKVRLGNWVSAGGVYQDYWGGAPPNSESCACGVNNTCQPDKSKKCNCDARSDSWRKDEGFLTATADLPVTQVVFRDVSPSKKSEANFTVGNLHCTGNISNTATFINEDGMIRLGKWTPPSHGVISLFFRTPYPKGTLLYNGVAGREYFKLYIINETHVGLEYDIGNGYQRVEMSLKGNKQVNDRQWHEVVIFRNMMEFGLKLDSEKSVNKNPLFLKKDLDLEGDLLIGGDREVAKGFVGCIRGLTINGEVIDLNKKAGSADYVQGGCGAACKSHQCKLGGKCLDNYNVYKCDCSLTPFYGYFCHKDYGASFEKDSQLTYTFPTPESVPGVDIVVGFKVKAKDGCGGDIVEITSQNTDENFLLRLDPASKKLKFSYKSFGGDGSFEIDPPFSDFCDETRHTFALSRRNEKVNYTVDGQSKPVFNEDRLAKPFPKMEKIIIGRKGDTGFKGCLTGVKVTRFAFEKAFPTVEPIKDYVYEDVTKGMEASGLSSGSDAKCGLEPEVPKEIPTPRTVGAPDDSDNTNTQADPTSGQRADEDNKTAIIIVVVLILVLLLVVLLIAIYWYWARHKGEYHTHEDDDALKSTDPYIDMTAPRKPLAEDTEKKKEWYI